MNEYKRDKNQTTLGEAIQRLLKAYRLDNKMKELDVVAAWPELMGPAIANRTKSIRIQQTCLYLEIESSVMREELLHGKQIIIDRMNAYAGKQVVTDIWFS